MKILRFAPIILPIFAFFLYLFTAAPFTLWLDAPRFVSAIYELGVPNPPEPLYLILAKPFTYLPFGSIIFRIQIFSALTAAATLFLLYKVILIILNNLASQKEEKSESEVAVKKKWVKGKLVTLEINPTPKITQKIFNKDLPLLASIFGLAALAFSYQFWSQAQNVETFILVSFLEVLTIFLLLKINSRKSAFINLSLVALTLGLATGTNPVLACVVPAVLWMMWLKRKFLTIPGFLVWILIGIVAIILIHLYIPIRAAANPFLNYWRATDFESVWNLSTGAGLNVYVPQLGRVNGFTMAPEIFLGSVLTYFRDLIFNLTILLPFSILGLIFLWKKSRTYFFLLTGIIITNFIFSGLYYSGNQQSWFLISSVVWAILSGVGVFWLLSNPQEILPENLRSFEYLKLLNPYILILAFIPVLFWFPFLNRRGWSVTEDYIENLYRPMGDQKAIIFGSSDLYDSISFYTHDVQGTANYHPNVVPITDNIFYIYQWYRDNLSSNIPDLKMPDGSKLKYNSALEYSQFVNDFFAMNMDKYKIYVSVPAMRNNFLLVYGGTDNGSSLKIDTTRFKTVPQGMLMQVLPKEATDEPNLANFDYKFKNGFPKKKPFMLEKTYLTELSGVLNEYAYSYEALGDYYLQQNKPENVLDFYQKAYDFNPKNAEVVSRLGNYYGQTGNHQKAAEYFEKALKLEPGNVGLLFNAAMAYENTGRIDKAVSLYNRALQSGKNNPQITQLATARLQALKNATPSAQIATDSAQVNQQPLPPQLQNQQAPLPAAGSDLQAQLMPKLPPGIQLFQNEKINLQFLYPQAYKVTDEGKNVIKLSNNLKDKQELTFHFTGRSMAEKETLDSLAENLPFVIDGAPLMTQPVNIQGFEASGKTYGTGEHLTFLLLLKKGNYGWAIKIYPGDSAKSEDFNNILSSIRPIK